MQSARLLVDIGVIAILDSALPARFSLSGELHQLVYVGVAMRVVAGAL